MRQSTYKFYQKGTDKQKRADMTFDFKRPDADKVKNWSLSEKILAKAYLEGVKERFEFFMKETQELIK